MSGVTIYRANQCLHYVYKMFHITLQQQHNHEEIT